MKDITPPRNPNEETYISQDKNPGMEKFWDMDITTDADVGMWD